MDRGPCHVVTELLSLALTLFFSFTISGTSEKRSPIKPIQKASSRTFKANSSESSSSRRRYDRDHQLRYTLSCCSPSLTRDRTPAPPPPVPKGPIDFERLRQSKDFDIFLSATAEMQIVSNTRRTRGKPLTSLIRLALHRSFRWKREESFSY